MFFLPRATPRSDASRERRRGLDDPAGKAVRGEEDNNGMSGLPFNFGPLYRHVALPTIAASPDGRPWDTTPGSHRWLGARVAWEFGEDVYAGTCTGWKKRDNMLGYAIWFVC